MFFCYESPGSQKGSPTAAEEGAEVRGGGSGEGGERRRLQVRSMFESTMPKARSRSPPAPMNHVKIFKGCPPRDAHSKLVQLWYKIFPTDQRGQLEIKKPTRLSNKTSTA